MVINKVWADRLGRVVYVGTRGANQPSPFWANGGLGTVLRFDGPFTMAHVPTPTVLANASAQDHPFGFATAFLRCEGHEDDPNGRYTNVLSITADPHNPFRVLVGLGTPAAHAEGNFPPQNGVWSYDPTVGNWQQLLGASGSSSAGANRPVVALTFDPQEANSSGAEPATLYVGTDGQGPFWMPIDVTAPPGIAAATSYPMFAHADGSAHAIGVLVSPAANTAIDTVTVDLRPWGGSAYEPLRDGGVAPDLVAGDGIFTSDLLDLDVGDPGTIWIDVFAQASDGGYASRSVSLEVLANPIDENAVYRFRAGSTDTSYVLAVSVASPPLWERVTANLASIAGPDSLVLADDGLDQDVKSGDGIFTSARFAASMPDTGAYVALITAEPEVGGPVTQPVSMLTVANAAKFTVDSDLAVTTPIAGALSGDLASQPYAAVYFWAQPNDDESDKVMISTFDDNETAPGMWGRTRQLSGVDGPFESRAVGGNPSWLTEPLPAGGRGVCYADFYNDGDTDFFLCNPTYGGKLYMNYLNDASCPVAWRGKFINRTSAICGADSVYLAGAISASWGDYTEDGFVDLFVSTAAYSGPIDELDELPAVASGSITGGDLRLFKNVAGKAMKKAMIFGSSSSPICLAGCWVDLDDDGDLDLVTTRYAGGGLSVLENHGINATHTDQDMEEATWAPTASNLGANSITIIDYDHDAHLDLFVTECTGSRKQAWVLRNNYGSAGSKTFSAVAFGPERAWSGAVVADFNLDGQDDFVLLPKEADVVPPLYMSSGYMTLPEFEDPSWPIQTNRATPFYADLGYTLGLRDGRTGGGFAADLDGDHAADLFLGRTSTPQINSQFLYRNTGTAAATNHWLQVNVRTCGGSNGSLIGTRVQVVANGKQWLKVVDGGSFRGGQGSNDLLFGLADEASVDYVKIMFPSGEVDQLVPSGVDRVLTAHENAMGGVVPGSASFSYELKPGAADWVFRWQTTGIKGDLREDRVSVSPYSGTNECLATPTFQRSWGMSGVSVFAYRVGSNWQHELRWFDGDCITGCRWSFVGYSGAGADCEASVETPTAVSPRLTYCIPGNYGQ